MTTPLSAQPAAPDEWHQVYLDAGYLYCRPEGEYHRPPECPIDEQGRALAWCGCAWTDVEAGHHATPH
jgi:hypothetical protein